MKWLVSALDDDRTRTKALLFACLVGTLASVVVSAITASFTSIALLSTAGALAAFIFVLSPGRKSAAVELQAAPSKRDLLRFAWAPVTATILFCVGKIMRSPELLVVHAAAEKQFEAALSRNPNNRPSQLAIRSIQSQLQVLIARQPRQSSTRNTLISDFAKMQAALVLGSSRNLPRSDRTTFEYVPPEPPPDGKTVIEVERNSPLLPETNRRFLFADLDFKTQLPQKQLLAITHFSEFNPIFVGCKVSDFSVELGSAFWIDVTFEGCSLSYSGGALLLTRVVANNCALRIGSNVDSQLGEGLRKAISSRESITFTSEFPS